jgi:hypothetical protein
MLKYISRAIDVRRFERKNRLYLQVSISSLFVIVENIFMVFGGIFVSSLNLLTIIYWRFPQRL